MGDSAERNRVYDFARRHGLPAPYDFAIYNERSHDDPGGLADAARRWRYTHLTERRARLEEEMEELKRQIEIVDNSLERNETEGYGT